MFQLNLVSKTCLAGLILLMGISSANAIEGLPGFDEIFGNIKEDNYRQSRPGRDYVFDAPSFKRRPKGKNTITAKVDLSEQRMQVYINDSFWQEWIISSGAKGYSTPTGRYRPTRLHEEWYSRAYYNTPMPHSVFFHGGYAIHATTYLGSLGRAQSHGCVRLHPEHAKAFFEIVQDFGMGRTNIIITQ